MSTQINFKYNVRTALCVNKKAVLSQRWPRNAPYTWVPWKFSRLPDYAHGYYSQHFYGLLFGSTLWMFLQNLKSVALSVHQIIGGTPKIWTVPGYALAPFSPKFLIGFYYRAMHFSANARYWDRMSSVCPFVRLSVCNVGDLWSHRLEILETNCTDN